MATLEERLIGFQVVRKVNQVTEQILLVAGKCQLAKDDAEAAECKIRLATIKESVKQSMKKLDTFLAKYPEKGEITGACSWMKITEKAVLDDLKNLSFIATKLDTDIPAATDTKQGVEALGEKVISLIEQNVTEIADVNLHYAEDQTVVSSWDLVNAVTFVLLGTDPDNGGPFVGDIEAQKKRIKRHLKTFFRMTAYLENSKFEQDLVAAMVDIQDDFDSCETSDELKSLGEKIDGRIPRAPLLRRYWQYA